MPKTLQSVIPDRIEPTADGKSLYVYFVDRNGSEWEALVSAEDVIELTEEQSNFPGGNAQGRRWVSRREAVDE